MCAMKKENFLDLAPGYVGDILYEHLHLLQTDATTTGAVATSSNTRTTTSEGSGIGKDSKPASQHTLNNHSKLSSILSNNSMAENNNQHITTGNGFQSENSQISPQQHVPYPYHQVSPSLPTDGATAAAMAVAAQHHALYNYSTGVSGGYPQGNVSATGGYDSYHQFYAAAAQAMAATAMAAARSYGEGQGAAYGYPQVSPSTGRDQQYPHSHHQGHSSLQYNPLSFSASHGHGGNNNTSNRSLSSPPSQTYHSSFAVSLLLLGNRYKSKSEQK